jgi:hypothetical protein
MIKIETEIVINSSVGDVWRKLTAFDAYPTWNPFVTRISGDQVIGSRLAVDITPPGGKKTTFKPILVKFCENKELRWIGVLGSKYLFQGEHYFKLEPIDGNMTRFIHGEIFSGLLARPLLSLIGASTKKGFESMNHALTLKR